MLISRTGTCKAGFTLFELVVVVFLLSVIAAFVLPTFSGLGQNRLTSEAREMASILRYMYDSAVSHKETFMIKFNFDEDTVYLEGPDGEKAKKFDNIADVTTQSRGRVSTGELIFFFEPLGIRENLSVRLNKEGEEMTVTVNHLSGRVKII
ncbi:MAG: prepilin-type N-terminal cleavage/methylation domain-containing protein [Nitrospirota bacterium]